jgi:cell division control protein 6
MIPEPKIFKNEEILSPEYLPELLPHRENQIKQLANNLLPAAKGRKPQNTFLFGPPGIGKTAVTKYVFREFEEYSGIKAIYINCWGYRTAVAILSKVVIDLGTFVQRRSMSKDEIIEKLKETCNKTRKGLIICLDEVDQMEKEVLYDLLRINQYIDNPVGIVFISNNPFVFVETEPRVRSSLSVEEIEFKAYSLEEMKNILKERARLAFAAVEEGVVLLAANCAVQNGGDARVGLDCLQKSGRIAEQENSDKVKVEHIKRILSQVKPAKPEILKEKIDETEKTIFEIVKKKKYWLSGELYQSYCERVEKPVSERLFRDFVNHLAEINLIKIRERKRGVKGRMRVISR